ncbi:DUF6415 family natural product biosynthesis protein [Streptomyces sp. NPDC058308]|uniref:DUF6415 family natural product biosynthesis protein n=1 Tax=Streptomyces sp. NPDC058308 TaxID=3346440 RepID=UPI0036E9D6AB
MSTTVAAQERALHDIPKWVSSHSSDDLRTFLRCLTAWQPLDLELIFDDLDTAIGNQPPPVTDTTALIERLRIHLARLSDIAVADAKYLPTTGLARLIERGRSIREERVPAEHQQAIGLARRLAFVTSDLVEELIGASYIKGAE